MPLALQRLLVTGILIAPTASYAHGEEIIVSLGAQLLAVVVCVAISLIYLKPNRHRALAILGGFLGVGLSWFVTRDWPYLPNRTEITALGVVLPVLGTLLVLVLTKVLSHGKRVP